VVGTEQNLTIIGNLTIFGVLSVAGCVLCAQDGEKTHFPPTPDTATVTVQGALVFDSASALAPVITQVNGPPQSVAIT
jgi:hypothetical protein